MSVIFTRPDGYQFFALDKTFMGELSVLGDLVFGPNYFAEIGLERDWEKIAQASPPISFCVVLDSRLVGARISYPPGQWSHLSAFKKSHPALWPAAPDTVAYFKLSMVHPSHRREGLALQMASFAANSLKGLGAKGVLTHSWDESPEGASASYTKKFGFQKIAEIPSFWAQYDYECLVCQRRPCGCKATELYLEL